MTAAALVLTLVGLVASLSGAVWLLFGIRPDDQRFLDDGPLYPGQQQSLVLARFIRAQRKPTLLVVIGGGLQVLGGVLAITAAL